MKPFLSAFLVYFGLHVAAHAAIAMDAQPPAPSAVAQGKLVFTQQCAACHTLTNDGIGPPLGGVTKLLAPAELKERIRNMPQIIAAGDMRAIALLARYKAPMPAFPNLSDGDVTAVLAFIAAESSAQNLAPLVVDAAAKTASDARLIAPIVKSDLAVEFEDVVQIPRLPGRTPYKGITLLRADPRESGALLIDELMGLIYRVEDRQVSVFLDVRPLFADFICEPGVASGLGSFALHPDFVRNGIFYTIHSETYRGSPAINATDIPADVPPSTSPRLEWVLSEWHLAESAPGFSGTHREVLRFVTPTTAHAAQEIAFAPVTDAHDPDYGMLYIGIGDGGATNLKRPDMSGHVRTFLGSILRIDPAGHNGTNGQYGIPADNPFAESGDPTIRKEIWAYGFRNPHRFSWDVSHGKRMIAVDIGESNVEEVNLIEKGGAYGWGLGSIEGTTRINVKADAKIVYAATVAELAPFHLPFAEYDHIDGSAVTGGFVYEGPIEALRDKYVFGDIVNGRLLYLNMGTQLSDHTIHELTVIRDGAVTTIKTLAHADRAHLRLGYDESTKDLYVLTKDDGMVRRLTKAYQR